MNSSFLQRHLTIYKALLAASIIFFTGMLIYGFPDSPSPWFDEGINLGIVKSWVTHGVYSMQVGPSEFVEERSLLITTNYPLLAFSALAFKFFGVGLAQAKIVMFTFLTLFLFLSFQLVKKYYGQNAAAISLALLVTFLPLYGNGKSALGEVPGLTYFVAGLLLLDQKKFLRIFLAGLLFGLAAATKPVYLLFLASIGLAELFLAVKNRELAWRSWLVLALGMAAPLLGWIYTLFPEQVTPAFFEKTLQLYRNPYRAEQTVLQNFTRFFTEATPIHFLALFGVFLASKALASPRRALTKMELIITLFIILNIIFYLKTVGWYRYFFPAHTLAILLFPGGIIVLLERFFGRFSAAVWLRSYALTAIFGILIGAHLLTIRWRLPGALHYNPEPRQFAEQVGRMVPREAEMLVVDNPALAFLIKHDNLRQYVATSPHIIVGRDLFEANQLPEYLVAPEWSASPYLKNYLSRQSEYALIIPGQKYNLYRLRR